MINRTSISIGAIAVAALLGSASTALGDARSHASCVGFEASGISPAGSSDEFPGGMSELQAFLRDTFGTQTGGVVSSIARQHLGSHEACDAE